MRPAVDSGKTTLGPYQDAAFFRQAFKRHTGVAPDCVQKKVWGVDFPALLKECEEWGPGNRRKLVDMGKKKAPATGELKGWTTIAKFLGLTPASAQRWAKEGMPVRHEGRFTVADPKELEAWLGRESHMKAPARVMTGEADIAAALKDSIKAARETKRK
ncbi:MAG TPA: hypothetical protein VE133_11995 [Candidatus Sulfotelmatobacter sp.]|nr:hypothetical protein [Candidatus Sulfotelmatobacter sp.]